MLVDLHVVAPPAGATEDWARLLRACAVAGLDGVCLVAVGSPPAMEEARQAASRWDLQVFFGVEFAVGRGRVILIPARPDGFEGVLPGWEVATMDDVDALARRTDSVVMAVHPYDRSAGTSFSDGIFQLEGLDVIEVANATRSETANHLALDAALRLHLAPVAGTGPATSPHAVGRAATAFARRVSDQASLVEALRRGEVFPVEMTRRGGGSASAERRAGRPAARRSREGGT